MNLRKIGSYDIGLDIGTGSVGWAVTDENGDLCHFKGKPTWGSRLFSGAETAAAARAPRGQRRRYIRRRWRLDLLQGFFCDEMEKVDPEFFIRLRQSNLWPDDRAEGHGDYRWPLFNGEGFNEAAYYARFPTIYHLRSWLMETNEKADLRLVYLALHNIVKHRGNFLREGEKLSSKNANMQAAVDKLCDALEAWCEACEIPCAKPKRKAIREALEGRGQSRSEVKERIVESLGLERADARLAKAIASGVVGLKVALADIFDVDFEKKSIYLSNEEDVDAFLEVCQGEWLELFEAMRAAYAAFVLSGMLSNKPGEPLSSNKVAEYERYGNDLARLKELVREYAPGSYDRFFRGTQFDDGSGYDPSRSEGYTLYNLGVKKLSYEDFGGAVKKLFKDTGAIHDERYLDMERGLGEGTFLRRLKTSDNGSIPHQLHLEELQAIVENQGKHYPFLCKYRREIESLVTFRIPYYVGPLTQKNAACDANGKQRFAWSQRKPGMEAAKIYPWNWDDVIDKHASAEAFIRRMTGTCTYIHGAPVLPKCSLLYEEFCMLNELNGAKWSQDGDKFHRFSAPERQGIVKDLFGIKKVTYKAVEDWMARQGHSNVHVSGGQGEKGFESKLGSHIFFCKDIFHVDELPEADIAMIEEIILWSTLFEDRGILRDKLQEQYGNRLDEEQVKKICKKRFAGWGRLSEEFLCGVKVQTDDGQKSVMDVLREGDPNNGHSSRSMVLMELLRDDSLAFERAVDERNEKLAREQGGLQLDDLPGSPALRRGIRQALRIVEEIAGIAGHAPTNVFIEVTREEDAKNKGKRTKRRYDRLKEALEAFKKEDPDLWSQLIDRKANDLDERLTLYFMQRGKSLYSQKSLDIHRLSEYEVDHILPQSYIKDDSFENKALVLKEENQRKTDTLLLDDSIRRRCAGYWKELLDAKLIGEKKYKNLTRTTVRDSEMKGFIARQLVETSQIVKFVGQMISERYEDARVVPIKAGISSQLRKARGFAKCRAANDYHHAHDAYLACQVGRFVQKRHSEVFDNPVKLAKTIRQFIRTQGEEYARRRRTPGDSSFIVQSFLRSGFDKDTGEIFRDDWDADREVDRIRRCLNFRDCFISRMPEETAGAFWDATIYSPRGGKKAPGLPLKRGLDPQKYGGYSREQFAYFFMYEVYDPKKKLNRLEFDSVPVSVAARVEADPDGLPRFAQELANQKGCEFVRVVRKKIHKYQLVELEGNRLYITGIREVRNATQFSFSQRQIALLKAIGDGNELTAQELDSLFDAVREKYLHYASRLGNQLGIERHAEAFYKLENAVKAVVLARLIAIAKAETNMIDLKAIGGATYAGCMQPDIIKLFIDSSDAYFIDQSVTGMFERRYGLGL